MNVRIVPPIAIPLAYLVLLNISIFEIIELTPKKNKIYHFDPILQDYFRINSRGCYDDMVLVKK